MVQLEGLFLHYWNAYHLNVLPDVRIKIYSSNINASLVYLLVDCGDPGAPVNGNFVLENDTFEDSIARYSCSFGFELIGNDQRVCQSNGNWTGTIPTCQRKCYLMYMCVYIYIY